MRHRSLVGAVIVAAGAISLAGCSEPDFADHAEGYLDDVEGANGEDYSEASCEEPATDDVGATFTCTALDANGATISFVGEITSEDEYVLREAGTEEGTPSGTTVAPDVTPTTVADSGTTTSAP